MPYEIVLVVADQLDIVSLVSLAATNTNVRALVRAIPFLAKIKAIPNGNHVFYRMLLADSAKRFTLQDVNKIVTSSSCAVCHSSDHLAPYLCLLTCRRLCHDCVVKEEELLYIPVETAIESLKINVKDLLEKEVVAQARLCIGKLIQHGRFWTHRADECRTKVAVISFSSAVATAARHYETVGGMDHVKSLLTQYVADKGVYLGGARSTSISAGYQVCGLASAISYGSGTETMSWIMLKYSLVVSLPFLNEHSSQPLVKQGFECEGCAHDEQIHRPPGLDRAYYAYPKLYLKDQFERHFKQCPSALLIANGQRLTARDQIKLRISLSWELLKYWPDADCPQEVLSLMMRVSRIDATPDKVKALVAKTSRVMVKLGGKAQKEQQRVAG